MSDEPVTMVATADTCRACGQNLDSDQRYCLNCGARTGERRVTLAGLLTAMPAPAPPPPPPTLVDRAGGPVGIVATLLAALGIGLLIGRGGHDDKVKTLVQRPPVVNVQSAGGTPAAGATSSQGATPSTATPSSSSASNAGKSASGGASSSKSSAAPKPKKITAAQQKAAAKSTADAQRKLKNAPKVESTGGKAPPKDDKPAGGGSSAETIG